MFSLLRACSVPAISPDRLGLKRFLSAGRLHFSLIPDFLSDADQRILLAAALHKLDSAESGAFQRRRKKLKSENTSTQLSQQNASLQDLFLPDEYYQFEEGHYDGVIHHYRESHVTSWAGADTPALASILNRIHGLCPTNDTQTHLLHLSSNGEILPHIDNISASGSWILGVSLGAERIMRMEGVSDSADSFDVLLPSGSVYLQRDTIRYGYKHSILKEGTAGGHRYSGGQRLSLMVRDRLPVTLP